MSFDVAAYPGGARVNYSVLAKNEDEAIFKVVRLNLSLNWPLARECHLTNNQSGGNVLLSDRQ